VPLSAKPFITTYLDAYSSIVAKPIEGLSLLAAASNKNHVATRETSPLKKRAGYKGEQQLKQKDSQEKNRRMKPHTDNNRHDTLAKVSHKYRSDTTEPDTLGGWRLQAELVDRSLPAYTPAPSNPSFMGALVP
jgi:hypothetical protein